MLACALLVGGTVGPAPKPDRAAHDRGAAVERHRQLRRATEDVLGDNCVWWPGLADAGALVAVTPGPDLLPVLEEIAADRDHMIAAVLMNARPHKGFGTRVQQSADVPTSPALLRIAREHRTRPGRAFVCNYYLAWHGDAADLAWLRGSLPERPAVVREYAEVGIAWAERRMRAVGIR